MGDSWNWSTYFFYLFLGIYIVFIFKCYFGFSSMKPRLSPTTGTQSKLPAGAGRTVMPFLLIGLPLVVFASARAITPTGIGGSDTYVYLDLFWESLQYEPDTLYRTLTLKGQEPLYELASHVVRIFTGNFRIFLFFYSLLILLCMVRFIQYYSDNDANHFILILVILPYLYSFSSMRSSIAVALSLVVIICIHKKNPAWPLFLLVAALFHYTALVLLPFIVVQALLKVPFKRKKLWNIFLVVVVFVVFLLAIEIVRPILLTTKYRPYVTNPLTWQGQFIILILFALCIFFYDELVVDSKSRVLLYLLFYNVMLLPIVVNLGGYRLTDYFLLVRLMLWGKILYLAGNRYLKGAQIKHLYAFCTSVVILLWFTLRISRMMGAGIMPYILNF